MRGTIIQSQEVEPLLATITAASIQGQVATGERAGQPVRRRLLDPEEGIRTGPLCFASRGFRVDVTICPACGGFMRIIAALTEPRSIVRYLEGVGLPSRAPPIAPARALFAASAFTRRPSTHKNRHQHRKRRKITPD
jgi:hypothetical protein